MWDYFLLFVSGLIDYLWFFLFSHPLFPCKIRARKITAGFLWVPSHLCPKRKGRTGSHLRNVWILMCCKPLAPCFRKDSAQSKFCQATHVYHFRPYKFPTFFSSLQFLVSFQNFNSSLISTQQANVRKLRLRSSCKSFGYQNYLT